MSKENQRVQLLHKRESTVPFKENKKEQSIHTSLGENTFKILKQQLQDQQEDRDNENHSTPQFESAKKTQELMRKSLQK